MGEAAMKFEDEGVRIISRTAVATAIDIVREKNGSVWGDKDEITARGLKGLASASGLPKSLG